MPSPWWVYKCWSPLESEDDSKERRNLLFTIKSEAVEAEVLDPEPKIGEEKAKSLPVAIVKQPVCSLQNQRIKRRYNGTNNSVLSNNLCRVTWLLQVLVEAPWIPKWVFSFRPGMKISGITPVPPPGIRTSGTWIRFNRVECCTYAFVCFETCDLWQCGFGLSANWKVGRCTACTSKVRSRAPSTVKN